MMILVMLSAICWMAPSSSLPNTHYTATTPHPTCCFNSSPPAMYCHCLLYCHLTG
jgi:hypothetical protein